MREIAREEKLNFRMALIHAEQDKAVLSGHVEVDGACKLLAVQTMKVWSSTPPEAPPEAPPAATPVTPPPP